MGRLGGLLGVAAFAILSVFAAGCSDPCVDVCEYSLSCDGVDPATDCAKACGDAKSEAETAGCSTEYFDLVTCEGSVDDVCGERAQCDAERSTYSTCLAAAAGSGG